MRKGSRFQAEETVGDGSEIVRRGCGSWEKRRKLSWLNPWCSGRKQARAPECHRPHYQSVIGHVISGPLEKLLRLNF